MVRNYAPTVVVYQIVFNLGSRELRRMVVVVVVVVVITCWTPNMKNQFIPLTAILFTMVKQRQMSPL